MEVLKNDRTFVNGFDVKTRLVKSFKDGFMNFEFQALVDNDRRINRRYYNLNQAVKQFEKDTKQVIQHFSKPIKKR